MFYVKKFEFITKPTKPAMIVLFSGCKADCADDFLKHQITQASGKIVESIAEYPTHIIVKNSNKISQKIHNYISKMPDGSIQIMLLDEFITKYKFKMSLKRKKTHKKTKTTIVSDSSDDE